MRMTISAAQFREVAVRVTATGVVVCAFAACSNDWPRSDSPESSNTASLAPVAVTRLSDSDTAYIGIPISLAVSAGNDYFIIDQASIRVMRYDSSGRFQGTFGRYGQGPNEFMMPFFIELVDDSTVLVSDVGRRDFTLWNVDSVSVRSRVPYEGEIGFFAAERGIITGTVFNRLTGTIAAKWRLPATQPQYLGTLPAVFAPSNRFASIYGYIPLATFNDSVAYFTGESDYLRIADSTWNVTDSIPLPRRNRRGVPEVIDYTMGNGRNIYDVMSQLSIPYALHRLSESRFAVLHLDYTVRNNVPMGSAFLTVVGERSVPRCIDIPLPVHDSNTIPRVAFRGDTLFVLDQYISGERAVIDIQRFSLAVGVC